MIEKNLVLPFITKSPNENEHISYQTELAIVVCIAESQRKKPGFLRDASEKTSFISKVYYPLWILSSENVSLILDGLNTHSHNFEFQEPRKTANFIEELKKNSADPKKFADALKLQTNELKEFSSQYNLTFPALMNDRELLDFLADYFNFGSLKNSQEETFLIPFELKTEAASQIGQQFATSLRMMLADAEGLRYALEVLKEELDFQTTGISNEIENLKIKLEAESAVLKPVVEKAVKKLTQKYDKAVVSLQRSLDRKRGILERRQEKNLRKLQVAEQKKASLQRKIDAAKAKKHASKSSANAFALNKYRREIESAKREVKAVSDEIDVVKKEAESNLKNKKMEYQKAVAQEENKLIQLNNLYNSQTAIKLKELEEMTANAAKISSSLENRIDELRRSTAALKSQVQANWKLENPENPVLAMVPLYLIKYTNKDEDEKYNLLAPIALTQDSSMLNGLKNMLALRSEPKLKTLIHFANKRLQETLNASVLNKIHSDPTFRIQINEICRNSNLIDVDTFNQILNEGLDEIESKGWMTKEESAAFCRIVNGEKT